MGHIVELCDEYNKCKKVQFCTEKLFRDIPFFVILHHFVSTMTCHVEFSAEKIHQLMIKIWNHERIAEAWKQGLVV